MSRLCQRLAVALSLLAVLGVACATFPALAQDKKDAKKDDAKKDAKKDDKKKDDAKKDDKKKDDKKIDDLPKKEPFKPDTPLKELKGHKNWIFALSYTTDGKFLATASRDRTVKIWDVDAAKDVQTLKDLPADCKGVVFLDGGAKVAVSSWLVIKKKIDVKKIDIKKDDVKKDDKGKDDKGKEIKKVEEPPPYGGEIRIYDAKSGKLLSALKGHTEFIEALALSKDGKFLASASEDQTVKIWDLAAGKDGVTLKGHTGAVHSVVFSTDGKKLATASSDRTVKVWDASGKDVATFKVEKEIKTVDPKTKKETVTKDQGRPFTSVAISPDGKRLAAGNLDGFIKVYDLDTNKEVHELKAHEGVWAVAFSPDGSKLATGGYDQTIKIWDVASGKDQGTIKAHLGTVIALSFSPNGQFLASGGLDGLVKIWNPMKK